MSGASRKTWLDHWLLRAAIPIAIGAVAMGCWELLVHVKEIPEYILPAPSVIGKTLVAEWDSLSAVWLVTLQTMFASLGLAVVGGVLLAMLFSVSRLLEISLFPHAVVLQVTPLIAIAPLIMVWLGDYPFLVLLLCAFIVSFFPILSNTVVGLKSADHNLGDLMRLYRASPWQRLRFLLVPTALPYFLAGLKIAANLALVGAVVGEFVVGPGGDKTGLASTILESSFRLDIAKMFAALALISATGITAYLATHALSQLLLGAWHESAVRRDA